MLSFFCRAGTDLDKISETGAEWHVDCDDLVKIETKCRISVWQTFGRIQWHIILEPRATLQGAATWRIQCPGPRAMCHIAGCCHRANSMSWSHSHVPHCRVLPCGKFNVMIPEPHATLQGERIPSAILKNFFFTVFYFRCPNAIWACIIFDALVCCQLVRNTAASQKAVLCYSYGLTFRG